MPNALPANRPDEAQYRYEDQSMSQNRLFRAAPVVAEFSVASPCVSVCRMSAVTGYCEGCWRTVDEIAAWSRLDAASKRALLAQLEDRRFGDRR